MSNNSNTLVLRNYPDDDALKHPENYPKALSFSPDIVPLYGTKANQDELIHSASWRGFAGMPIVGGDVNNVYIRGHGSGGPYIATLRAFPSELILWPQVWSSIDPVSSGPVVISGGDTVGPYASDDHMSFRPPHAMGNAYSLVANVFEHHPDNVHKDLKEYEPIPSVDPEYPGVDGFLSFLSKDRNFTFYNVVVADPTLQHVSTSTRLRMFSKLSVPVIFRIEWQKGATVPAGLEVALLDDRGKISVSRTPLSSLADYKVSLDRSYDGILTLHIFSPAEHTLFEPYSCLSLKVFATSTSPVTIADPILPVPPTQPQLLGTLNVIFDPHSTRNLRFASPSATQLRGSKNCPGKDGCKCHDDKPGKDKCVAIPVTRPAATGWWFRSHMGDTNHFPHPGPAGHTPDIQPIGTDLTAPGLWTALQDPNIDYSDTRHVGLVGGKDNYIFVRGHSTIADIDIQSRVFAVKGSPMLHPAEYTTKGISAQVFDGSGKINHQTISVANANQFYLFNRPFDIKNPPNPNPGGDTKNPQHYCLIAEVRQKRKCSPAYPSWPSEQGEDFKTMQDFSQWMLSCPFVCFRNVNWVPCKPGPISLTWHCSTRLVIPDGSSACSFFTIIIECDNPIIPPGSKWTLMCDDNEIFPRGLCFENLPIDTHSPAYAGCHFTGGTPGRASSTLTLAVTWNDNGKNFPLPSVKIKLAATQVATLSPIKHLGEEPIAGSETWPFYVGNKYPYIGGHPNPSPLPTFNSVGPNSWPYSGSSQYVLGQVALAAKAE